MNENLLYTDGKWFKDSQGRVQMLRGVNLSGSTKLPFGVSSHTRDGFFEHREVSFVGRPFPLEEVDEHLKRLKSWGFTFVRFLITWEAIEHAGPGKYDTAYFDYVAQVLRRAKEHGLMCFVDPHQDVWSRFTGGSGAPGWTLELVGFDMTKFAETSAAVVHNTWPDPENFPRMIWPTNYFKLAASTMFTLFFGGKTFAPRCFVKAVGSEGEGVMVILSQEETDVLKRSPNPAFVHVQDYLQNHFCNALVALIAHLKRVGGLLDSVVVGYDTLNEPSGGFIGFESLTRFSSHQDLKQGLTPTALQGMLLGQGRACQVEMWDFGSLGPRKKGVITVDPRGVSCWRAGYQCIWAAHGLYDAASGQVLRDDYFAHAPGNSSRVDWIAEHWLPFVKHFIAAVRAVHEQAIIFVDTPVNEAPPVWHNSTDRICFTPHWYDGVTLMNKHFSSLWTVDFIGFKRGKYCNILAALSFGMNGIKANFTKQLGLIKSEGQSLIGDTPCVIGEIGIPYDMDDKKSYKPGGNYDTQTHAMDANITALERNLLNFTLWNYCSDNNNKWGDNWNGEDLSIFSRPQNSLAQTGDSVVDYNVGGRALLAFVRPYPVKTNGIPLEILFDYASSKKCFTFKFKPSTSSTDSSLTTDIYVPALHFGTYIQSGDLDDPQVDGLFFDVVAPGSWTFDASTRILHFKHDAASRNPVLTSVEVRIYVLSKCHVRKQLQEQGYALGDSKQSLISRFCDIL